MASTNQEYQQQEETPDRSLKAYGTLIWYHPGWGVLWLGEVRCLSKATSPPCACNDVEPLSRADKNADVQIASNLGNW